MMRSSYIKAAKDVLKECGLDDKIWMSTEECTISDNKGLLVWIVFRHSTASAIVFADKSIFQSIYNKFEECLGHLRSSRADKGKGKATQDTKAETKGNAKGKSSKGKVGRAAFDFDFDYRRPLLHQICQGRQLG